jgi:hypothetical protein
MNIIVRFIRRHGLTAFGLSGLILLLALTTASASRANETLLYVAPNGNDSWSGRLATPNGRGDGPFATIERARDAIRELKNAGALKGPVVVRIRGGEYFLSAPIELTPADSGTAAAPITYEAYPGDPSPVISGGRKIAGWQPEATVAGLPSVAQGHVWAAKIPQGWKIYELTVNGSEMPMAASPGDLEWRRWPTATATGFALRLATPLPAQFLRIAQIDVNLSNNSNTGFNMVSPLAELSPDGATATPARRFPFSQGKSFRYRIENTPSGMTGPGRWFVDSDAGRIYLWPPANVNPASSKIVGANLRNLLSLHGSASGHVAYVNFEGLTFSESNRADLMKAAPEELKAPLDSNSTLDAAITIESAEHCTFDHCRIMNVAGNGALVILAANDLHFTNNQIVHCGANGLSFLGYNPGTLHPIYHNLVEGNLIEYCGQTYWHSSGIRLAMVGSMTLRGNQIAYMPFIGIMAGGYTLHYFVASRRNNAYVRWNEIGSVPMTLDSLERFVPGGLLIENNVVHDVMETAVDGGAIYLFGENHCVIQGNRVYRTISAGSFGIYLDEDTIDSQVKSNIVYESPLPFSAMKEGEGGAALLLNNNGRNIVTNNIFALSNRLFKFWGGYGGDSVTRNIFLFGPIASPATGPKRYESRLAAKPPIMDYNLYWSTGGTRVIAPWFKSWKAQGWDAHSIVADPMFVNPAAGDFRLRPNSPAGKIGFAPIQ